MSDNQEEKKSKETPAKSPKGVGLDIGTMNLVACFISGTCTANRCRSTGMT